jgi:Putative Ig domain
MSCYPTGQHLRHPACVAGRRPYPAKYFPLLLVLASCTLSLPSCGNGPSVQQVAGTQKSEFLRILSAQLEDGVVGQPYDQKMRVSGGGPPYKWSLALGKLPQGLSLNTNTGTLSGTPNQSGKYTFTVKVADSSYYQTQTSLQSFTLKIQDPILAIVTSSLPGAVVNQPYYIHLRANWGTPPYTWSVLDGALPIGLQLDALTGEISGTPTEVGVTVFTIQVADSATPLNVARLKIIGNGAQQHSNPNPLKYPKFVGLVGQKWRPKTEDRRSLPAVRRQPS